jgi:hypothetical protein
MLRLTAILLLVMILCVGGIVLHTANTKTKSAAGAQDSPLTLTQTKVSQPGGGMVYNLKGRYQNGSQVVNIRAFTVKADRSVSPGPPQQNRPENTEERYDPGSDYYYSNSEMTRSDGGVLVEAVYEYQQPTNRSILYITLGGVALTFDLNTEEVGPLTDADEAHLNAWLASEDGHLVQDTSVAIINNGPEQTEPELLLNFYAIAMLVDTNPPAESASRSLDKKKSSRAHHASFKPAPKASAEKSIKNCFAPATSVARKGSLLNHFAGIQNCFGCCGWGCYCIRDRGGIAIYHQYCAQHDGCSGQYGRVARPCLRSLVGSIVVVWWRTRPN